MSSPGFTGGGGASEFFAGAGGLSGRSIAAAATMNNPITNPSATNNNHLNPSHHTFYRTQQQLPAMFLDPSSQIAQRQASSLIGKRTLAEFQTHQNHNHNHNHNLNSNNNLNLHQNQILSNLLLRSVKPRTTFQHGSPLSPMSPMDFSISELQNPSSGFQTQRFGVPLLHQLRPQPINLPNNTNNNGTLPMTNTILQNPNFPYRSSNLGLVQNRVQNSEPEKKIMENRLQELEKQLLEDNDEEGEADAASVITTSEWSETYQNLISPGPTQKPASSSPTSSTTSSTSSSTSVASPASGCSKQSLMEAASSISEGKHDAASEILARLVQAPNPSPNPSPNANSDQRLTDCMVSALKSRMNPVENPPPVGELYSREHAESTQLLLENSVCFKVGFMAANLAILEAAFEEKTENGNGFCVVDFDIGQGKQYVNLLSLLSARAQAAPAVKIVAVAENGGEEKVRAVGEMLSRQAERLRIRFEFRMVSVTQKLAELTRESLGCDPDEPLMVNFAFKLNRIPDESVSTENPRDELLRRVKKLAPRVVILLEQEMNANTAPFLARVAESWSYYSSLFDSIESVMGRDNSDRVRVEEGLSRKLCNSVACEGRDRLERCEVFGKWRARMSMAGFQLKPLSQSVAESIKSLGNNNRVNPGLTVKEENGGICFGWMGRTLTVASAWR
ncbi:scarecrow-like protein 8 [Gastrolobium bilobum]|uniref:scarecrow-like protein 8 n=1 Tax=Gastrolobium bilobum TaxID=150636 RepID=UPI002AB0827F|nr:scarecrow-like protein 8 [Gastrolobium bilobum]